MEASIVDLRYKMNDVLKALERQEEVTILYRGKAKGRILPLAQQTTRKIAAHPFFGMGKRLKKSVLQELNDLRSARTHAL